MRWAQQQRMKFIASQLAVGGYINRSHLVEEFQISTPQASIDLRAFQQINPAAMVYDKTLKRYVRREPIGAEP